MVVRIGSPVTSEQEFDISTNLVPDDADIDFTNGERSKRSKNYKHNIYATDELDAFKSDASNEDDGDAAFIAAHLTASNRKNATGGSGFKSAKKGGSFQSMGLNPVVLKAITRKGFSLPTPIQRKTIPAILDNKDVVGMARTGSGKTAAFVIPMIEKLKSHSVQVGARAIILSPSRELALQTLKATKDFGRGSDLRSVLLVGGDSLEVQFSQMTANPDVIIATPGRFLHLIVEMALDLSSVRYVVFDEADRLFEMGFATQLTEILHALPASRQTLLFSATLPRSLVEFAKAGLREPELIRLDAESKISPNLQSAFLHVKESEKEGALLHILQDIIKVTAKGASSGNVTANFKSGLSPHSTIVFAATKHHVEYLGALLSHAGFAVSYLYSSLDQTARQIQAENFRKGMTDILVVTDVAARGIDIPLLANVINYDFPPQSKVFVHRVGRTARAGSSGWSYSLVQTSDVPYLLDLQLFLAMPLKLGRGQTSAADFTNEITLGIIPRHKVEKHCECVNTYVADEDFLSTLSSVAAKGTKLYIRTRNSASAESVKRSKNVIRDNSLQEPHPIYTDEMGTMDVARDEMLARISGFRPPETIFEFRNKQSALAEVSGMMRKRKAEQDLRSEQRSRLDASRDHVPTSKSLNHETTSSDEEITLSKDNEDVDMLSASEDELEVVFGSSKAAKAQGKEDSWQDSDHYMSYQPKTTNLAEDRGYGVHSGATSNFTVAARNVTMDLTHDESKGYAEQSRLRWDKRSKKYVSKANDEDGSKGSKMIKGESGQKIAASFRSGRFDEWKKTQRLGRLPRTGEAEDISQSRSAMSIKRYRYNSTQKPKQPDKYRDDYYKKKKKLASKEGGVVGPTPGEMGAASKKRSEIKSVVDIQKQRKLKQRRREKNARRPRKE